MNVLFVIPAKATSSRIPGKNVRPLGGVPLFLWTVRAALEARQPGDTVLVSTNEGPDGDEIARLAVGEGATVLRRPPELCRDPAQLGEVVLHAIDRFEEQRKSLLDSVCALLPTSPFRTASQIRDALALHEMTCRTNVVSVSDGSWLRDKLHGWHPDALRIYSLSADSYWHRAIGPLTRPGTIPDSAVLRLLNGALWIATPDRIRTDKAIQPDGALPYVMDEESGLDIDTELDWMVAEAVVAKRTEAKKPCYAMASDYPPPPPSEPE